MMGKFKPLSTKEELDVLITNRTGRLLVVDEVSDQQFTVGRGFTVSLLDPQKGNYPDTTYSPSIRANVHGRNVNLYVPTLAFGKVVEDELQEPFVRIDC